MIDATRTVPAPNSKATEAEAPTPRPQGAKMVQVLPVRRGVARNSAPVPSAEKIEKEGPMKLFRATVALVVACCIAGFLLAVPAGAAPAQVTGNALYPPADRPCPRPLS